MTLRRCGAALLPGIFLLLAACDRQLRVPRNVLLITIDTLRADRLGCLGSDRGLTPHLDSLAAEGAVFSNAWTPVPLTAPSHASMLTGRYPITAGLRNNGVEVLSAQELLLPEILRERGFQTAGIVSALVLASTFGLNQGFDLYYEEDISGGERGRGLWYDQRPADKTIDRTLAWLRASVGRPFFLWVHLFDPHDPYDPPSPYKEKFAQALYDGEIAFADAQVGRLLEALREMSLDDSTLIIAAGDHGESLGDHGESFHGIFIYNATMRVPLIVRAPGGRRGVRVDDPASTLDITPTVLASLGIQVPTTMQGVSLLDAAARGGRVPARSLYLETIYPTTSYGWAAPRGIVSGSWKSIDLPAAELYDVASDPSEKSNLAGTQLSRRDALRSEYAALRAELESGAREAETASIDEETRDRLASLGYLAGEQSKVSNRREPDPKDVVFMMTPLNIAQGFIKKKLYADAEVILVEALKVDPENKFALARMTQAQAAQGKLDAALSTFERAAAAYPDVEEVYRLYASALMAEGRGAEASEIYRRGAERIPASGLLHLLRGYALFHIKDYRQAAGEIEAALGLRLRRPRAHYLLAICQAQIGKPEAALASLDAYLTGEPDVDSLLRDPFFASLRERPEFQEMIRRHL